MKKRLTNPVFLLALAGLIYTTLEKNGVHIEQGFFKDIVDVLAFVLTGSGIYASFHPQEEEGSGENEH